MKVNIKHTYPIIERDQSTPRHIHSYRVIGWEVQGTFLIDEKGCECMTKPFDFNLRFEQQAVTESELIEMVKKRLENENGRY